MPPPSAPPQHFSLLHLPAQTSVFGPHRPIPAGQVWTVQSDNQTPFRGCPWLWPASLPQSSREQAPETVADCKVPEEQPWLLIPGLGGTLAPTPPRGFSLSVLLCQLSARCSQKSRVSSTLHRSAHAYPIHAPHTHPREIDAWLLEIHTHHTQHVDTHSTGHLHELRHIYTSIRISMYLFICMPQTFTHIDTRRRHSYMLIHQREDVHTFAHHTCSTKISIHIAQRHLLT